MGIGKIGKFWIPWLPLFFLQCVLNLQKKEVPCWQNFVNHVKKGELFYLEPLSLLPLTECWESYQKKRLSKIAKINIFWKKFSRMERPLNTRCDFLDFSLTFLTIMCIQVVARLPQRLKSTCFERHIMEKKVRPKSRKITQCEGACGVNFLVNVERSKNLWWFYINFLFRSDSTNGFLNIWNISVAFKKILFRKSCWCFLEVLHLLLGSIYSNDWAFFNWD